MTKTASESLVRHVSGEAELAELVAEEPLVLAEFYSRSCPKCDRREPVLGLVAREFEGVVAMVEPEGGLDILRAHGVASTPGFVRFVDGDPVDVLAEGFVPAERLLAFARGELEGG